jgi:hypothetical protein
MAHLAKLENNLVIQIIVVDDSIEKKEEFAFDLFGGTWKLVKENKKFPTIGGKYLAEDDVFIGLKPFESWILNSSYEWEAPKPYPNDGDSYYWDEDSQEWIKSYER